jgi:hypothetical protein
VEFCTQYKDNLGIFNESFGHEASTLRLTIQTSIRTLGASQVSNRQENISFGLRDILLLLGNCPSNCLKCES